MPRHLTLAASLTIGIPGFFLALAPSAGRFRGEGFVEATGRRRGRWVVALGAVLLGAYALVLALPLGRTFFALAVPLPQMVAAAVAGSAAALAGLWLVGERFRISRRRLDLHSHRRDRGP